MESVCVYVQGIVPGIKTDKGLVPLANANNESWTQGLTGLADRSAEYYKQVHPGQISKQTVVSTIVFTAIHSDLKCSFPLEISKHPWYMIYDMYYFIRHQIKQFEQQHAFSTIPTPVLRDLIPFLFSLSLVQGARFCKWRAVVNIPAGPSPHAVTEAAYGLARYAAISQNAGLVPIVEPEIMLDGEHDIERTFEVRHPALYEYCDQYK
jgi:fructose-bisphosphate aldolase class 1